MTLATWLPRMTVHSLAVLISVLTYVLTTRVEHERRPPAVAIAWVLGMIAVPYAALPMYVMFGRRKLKRKASYISDNRAQGTHWAEDMIESFGLRAAAPCAVCMHQDGRESAAALTATMMSAALRLDICTYILGDDDFGHEMIQTIMKRVRSGVQVRLLIDGVGALQLRRSIFRQMRQAGVQIRIFSPLLARRTQGPRNLRNHRKLTIADGTRLWAGGRNIAAEYFVDTASGPAWIDLSFDLRGKVAAAAAAQFDADWAAAGGAPGTMEDAPIAPVAASATESAGGLAQFLPSGPDQSEDTVHALLIGACFHARARMLAVTPYFVPDASLEAAMRLAARRGVRIDLCLPARSNHRLADFARSRALRSLSKAGVNIHLLPYMIHAKGMVFDDTIAVTGSVNLDSRSLLLNYECAVVFYGSKEIHWLAQWIEALIPQARRYDARPPGLLRDVCEGLLLTVAYQL